MASIGFTHPAPSVGELIVDNGVDSAAWAYGVNTVSFPTYGGEVIQVLSVYVDDLTISGTISTYAQVEQIYTYFASYFSVATQGINPTPQAGQTAYNLQPMYLVYPIRNWVFKVYPKEAPGFRYARDLTAPIWSATFHIIDDSPDLGLIKDGLKATAVKSINSASGFTGLATQYFNLKGLISPDDDNPELDPFQTYDADVAQQATNIGNIANGYSALIPTYMQGDFAGVTGEGLSATIGSKPTTNVGQNQSSAQTITDANA